MPQVLTTNAIILCPHGGKGTTVPAVNKWQVDGGTVAAEGDKGVIAGCLLLNFPCLTYTLSSMGLNATTIDSRKAILVTDFNKTDTGLPLLMTELHKTFDETTPAPLPSDGSAPQIPAALRDLVAPIVQPLAAPPIPVKLTPTPAPVKFSFDLFTQYPLQWILTLISEKPGKSFDLTGGTPTMDLEPRGGDWKTPNLNISVTLTPAFLTALAPAKHHFYLTAVSQRGLTGNSHVTLEVTP